MDNDKYNINASALCVLKFTKDSKFVIVDFEPINRTLEYEFEDLRKLFEGPLGAEEILQYIRRSNSLKVLLYKYSYCEKLDDAFQGFQMSAEEMDKKYSTSFSDCNNTDEYINRRRNKKEQLLRDLQKRLHAYYIEEAYNCCEKKRLDKSILAYSHRKVGFATPRYVLNSDFSIELKTNFGYGSVSYFYTRITYKGLSIVPFSDWVTYERAYLFEMIRYSAKYELKNENWYYALQYAEKACNLSIADEALFVKKYIIEECERMVMGLENFLVDDKFRFYT